MIIDRLNACKWWKDKDSLIWAKVLLKVKMAMGEPIDKEYLRKRASEDKVKELLEQLLKG